MNFLNRDEMLDIFYCDKKLNKLKSSYLKGWAIESHTKYKNSISDDIED